MVDTNIATVADADRHYSIVAAGALAMQGQRELLEPQVLFRVLTQVPYCSQFKLFTGT